MGLTRNVLTKDNIIYNKQVNRYSSKIEGQNINESEPPVRENERSLEGHMEAKVLTIATKHVLPTSGRSPHGSFEVFLGNASKRMRLSINSHEGTFMTSQKSDPDNLGKACSKPWKGKDIEISNKGSFSVFIVCLIPLN
ncbi:hypothetical protein HPP92_011241 [Vanilla planifolia]|uniref:Uncharacterized protein n=1 Tax=Vanilla planifolia TaxID=51239 RepID=A0A835V0J9_VANPL|nr:hypothetical protein HPP92_011241 [Vanilla planifolia]